MSEPLEKVLTAEDLNGPRDLLGEFTAAVGTATVQLHTDRILAEMAAGQLATGPVPLPQHRYYLLIGSEDTIAAAVKKLAAGSALGILGIHLADLEHLARVGLLQLYVSDRDAFAKVVEQYSRFVPKESSG